MSTTAEYYIRNMSQYEFERYFERLQKQERKNTRKKIQAEIDRKVGSQLKKAQKKQDKESKALKAHIDQVSKANQKQHDCNQRMMSALEAQLVKLKASGDQQAHKVQKALDLLSVEQHSLQQEMRVYQEQAQKLETHIENLSLALEEEKHQRKQALLKASHYYQDVHQIYQSSRQHWSKDDCQRYGLSEQVYVLDHAYQQAQEQYQQGVESAAVATIAQCLRKSEEIQMLLLQRKDEESALKLSLNLKTSTCLSRLNELNQAEIRAYLAEQIDQAFMGLNDCDEKSQSDMKLGHWLERKERLKQQEQQLSQIAAQISDLYVRYDELVEQAAQRENILKGLVQALVEVWGGEYEMDVYLENPNDLSSNLLFRTKRGPFAPNVQASISIDGRMEASLTGYHGVECAQDEEQLREALSRRSSVEVVREQYEVIPDAPNPDGHGHAMATPSALTMSPVDQHKSAQQSLPRWMKKSV